MSEDDEARAQLYPQADELERAVRALPDTDPARRALIDQVNHLRFLLARDEVSHLAGTAPDDQRGGANKRTHHTRPSS